MVGLCVGIYLVVLRPDIELMKGSVIVVGSHFWVPRDSKDDRVKVITFLSLIFHLSVDTCSLIVLFTYVIVLFYQIYDTVLEDFYYFNAAKPFTFI